MFMPRHTTFCALLAMPQRRWSRRYLHLTQPRVLFLAGLTTSLATIHHIVAYVVIATTRHLLTTITVIPAILYCIHSPGTSPFPGLSWHTSRKTDMAVFTAVDHMVNFLGEYMSFAAAGRAGQRPH